MFVDNNNMATVVSYATCETIFSQFNFHPGFRGAYGTYLTNSKSEFTNLRVSHLYPCGFAYSRRVQSSPPRLRLEDQPTRTIEAHSAAKRFDNFPPLYTGRHYHLSAFGFRYKIELYRCGV